MERKEHAVPRGDVLAEARNLRRSFGSRSVLDDVSLTLHAGKVTGLVGANGAGKTTAIRLMLDLARGGGKTLFLGRPLHDWGSPGSIVGAVLGGVAGHPKHRVRSHLRMVAAGCGASDRRVEDVLEQVGLAQAARLKLSQLSLGMAQRLGIAQALLGDPPVLILDEPANGLDPHAIRWLRDFLRAQAAQGRAVMVSSHLLGEMEQLADRVVVLSRGRVVAASSIATLLTRARGQAVVTVQTPDMPKLSRLVKEKGGELEPAGGSSARITGLDRIKVATMAAESRVPLHWLSEEMPSLEDFYLSIAEEEFRIS
ncbi:MULTISPECIES: ABC transporter ATP-binding protein [unclassified Streptomyces]|uniref:ABC transporter ATP-binding protein n=1 Tax=unclassified Streptomyces TaxID=2593676 RepID=UPI000DAD267B|nr:MULTISPECIES: ATP-binding cassette domain-containing protein [unclassified Streptomyces]PZT75785.1 ABC transporter ATP-binding protein [Streptomyces sp. AC1-42W]PZT80260.1 ABC transporter ATP-binding protein [Streptomyces sp. AC1-42T]